MTSKVDESAAESSDLRHKSTLDMHALCVQINRHYAGLLSLLRARLQDEDLAKELLSQALLTSFEHFSSGRVADPSRLAGYIFHVAMNHLRNHRRKMYERVDLRADPGAIENMMGEASEQAPDLPQIRAQVRAILAQLPTGRDRLIVRRFYLDEEDKDDICRDLGLSALHFDRVIFRARQRMRALLEAKGFRKSDFFSFFISCLA
jgi:RNA polymerase sigma-70 factor (ECF subfamily)